MADLGRSAKTLDRMDTNVILAIAIVAMCALGSQVLRLQMSVGDASASRKKRVFLVAAFTFVWLPALDIGVMGLAHLFRAFPVERNLNQFATIFVTLSPVVLIFALIVIAVSKYPARWRYFAPNCILLVAAMAAVCIIAPFLGGIYK